MAFTIRKLTIQATKNLKILQDNNRSLKTKTKAIDYVLVKFYKTESHVKEIESKNDVLMNKVKELNQKLDDIKFAINILKNL